MLAKKDEEKEIKEKVQQELKNFILKFAKSQMA